ncbi:ectoine synthase/ParB multidomain protein [Pseudoalteromonas phage XCL1123]|nr:ectoine synthase/ParB multidomain protein [Pseudoalteromonas phage XCL1123]
MIKVINYRNLEKDRVVKFHAGVSRRILLKSDSMGFGMTRTTIFPEHGKVFQHYKNHQEACYCVKGVGLLTCAETGNEFYIREGDTYILDSNEPHYFEAMEEVVLICGWNPPLTGNEVHREDGSYSLDGSN